MSQEQDFKDRLDRAERINLLLAKEVDALRGRVEQLEAKGGANADPA